VPSTRFTTRALVSLAAVVVAACLVAPFFIHRTRYFYTDGTGFREAVTEARPPLRRLLWQPAVSLSERINQPETDEYEPRLSPGGRFLVFTRGRPGNADLWLCERRSGGWGEPSPLLELNSLYDEMGACFGLSEEPGELLVLFYSNRPGGEGGYDLWASLRHEDGVWSSPWNLGPQVNSPFNEYSPSITADAQLLLFASNRRSGKDPEPPRWAATVRETYAVPDYDIYHASRLDVRAIDFGEALRLEGLSLPDYSEGTIAIAPDSDYIYFASNRPDGKGGFDLYRARLSAQVLGKPENLGPQVNTRGQELDPALSDNGVELYFARQPESARTNDIFVAVSREVFLQTAAGETYWSLAAVRNFLIRILAAVDPTILALLLSFLVCLSFALLLSRRLSRSAILLRCIAIALLVHLLGALWMNTRKVHRVLLGTLGDKEVLGSFEVDLEGEAEDEIAFMIRNKVALTGKDVAPSFETGLPQVFAMVEDYDSVPSVLELDGARRFTESPPTAPVASSLAEDVPGHEPVPPEPVTEEEIDPLVTEDSTPLDPALALVQRGPTESEAPERKVRVVEFTSRVEEAEATFEDLEPLPVDLASDVEPEDGPLELPPAESPQPVAEVVSDPLEPETAEAVGLEAPSGPIVAVAAPRRLFGAVPTASVRTSRLEPRSAWRPSLPLVRKERVLAGPVPSEVEPATTPGSVDAASPPLPPPEEPTADEFARRMGEANGRDVEPILGIGLPPGERGDDPEGLFERRATTAPEILPRTTRPIEFVARVEVQDPMLEEVRPVPVDLARPTSPETSAADTRLNIARAQVSPMPADDDRGDALETATLTLDGAFEEPVVKVASPRRVDPARQPALPRSPALRRQREMPQRAISISTVESSIDAANSLSPLVATSFSSPSTHSLPREPEERIAIPSVREPSAREEIGGVDAIEIADVLPAGDLVASPALGHPQTGPTPGPALPLRRTSLSVEVSRNAEITSEDIPSLTVTTHVEPARARAKEVEPSRVPRSPVESVSRPDPVPSREEGLRLPPDPVSVTPTPLVATARPVKSTVSRGASARRDPELVLERKPLVPRQEAKERAIEQRAVDHRAVERTELSSTKLNRRPVPRTPSAVERSPLRAETRTEIPAATVRALDREPDPASPPRLALGEARESGATPPLSEKRPRALLVSREHPSSVLAPLVATHLRPKIVPARSGPTEDVALMRRAAPAAARRLPQDIEPATDSDVAGTLVPVRRPRDERPSLVAREREVSTLLTRPGRAKERATLEREPRRLLLARKPLPVTSAPPRASRQARIVSRPEPVSASVLSIAPRKTSRENLEPSAVVPPAELRVTVTPRAMRERRLSSTRRGGALRPLAPRARDLGLSPEMRPWVFPIAPLHPYLAQAPSGARGFEQGEQAGGPEVRPADPSRGAFVARGERQGAGGITEPGSLEPVAATSAFVPRIYELRSKKRRKAAVTLGGGSDETERAVELGLRWLALHQSPDGRWSLSDFTDHLPEPSPRDRWHPDWRGRGRYDSRGGSSRASSGDTAATGLALLAFLGHGDTHVEPGPYRTNVSQGLRFLVSQQRRDGDLRAGGNLYMHAIAAFAICEAYALTRSSELEEPARRAIDFTVRTQNPKRGGWRYKPYPRGTDVDTSVFGWMIMGIKSAHLAGIEVDERCVKRLVKYLDSVRMSADGGRYAYQPRLPRTSLAMVAQGLFCQQVLSELRPARTARERLLQRRATNESVSILLGNRPEPRDQDGTNFYYWYYAALALFQEEGVAWSTWNARMKPVLLQLQLGEKAGTAAGSWDPLSRRARLGGRVYSTAISILCLEVYYRYAPAER